MIRPYVEVVNGCELIMQPVKGGEFSMGDEIGDLSESFRPVHTVRISDFYIGKYPVTQALWESVVKDECPSVFQGNDLPVENVSWDDINQLFLPELRNLTGLDYRLPTEAEWEYAARGGRYQTEGYKFAGSDRLKDVGWFDKNSGNALHSIGLKSSNQLGIFDMSGNIWEWCEDWYGGHKYYAECDPNSIIENSQRT
jgi:sulfatase modifying factor 1